MDHVINMNGLVKYVGQTFFQTASLIPFNEGEKILERGLGLLAASLWCQFVSWLV